LVDIEAGKDVRELRKRAADLSASAARALAARPQLDQAIAEQFAGRQSALVKERLATVPIEKLREASTDGGLRLDPFTDAGYTTVASVVDATPGALDALPGVGPQTATRVLAAARTVAAAIATATPARLDPDHPSPDQAQLLATLRTRLAFTAAVAPSLDELAATKEQVDQLAATCKPAASRVKMLFSGGARKQAALDAASRLANGLTDPATVALAGTTRQALAVLDQPPPDAATLWHDYEQRASDYLALLDRVAGVRTDVAAVHGFVPSEIAEQVEKLTLDDSLLKVSLRGYQAFGAKFALVQRRSIIGDEMGLGKTIEALAAMAHLQAQGAHHFLVVCPASVVVNWVREVSDRSSLTPLRLHGDDRQRAYAAWQQQGGVGITTFETLRSLGAPPPVDLGLLVVDEAHFVKNPDAQRSQAVRRWSDHTERVLFLTGTPMENRVDEFRTLVGYLQPAVAARISGVDGLAGADAFRTAVAPAYLRRNQVDVLTELPQRIDKPDWLELTFDDQDAYRAAVASGNFMAVRRAAFDTVSAERCAKQARLTQVVSEAAENGWKVVVFSFFRDVLANTQTVLGGTAFGPLDGSTPADERQALVDRFSAVDGHAVLLSQIQAGGVGLNIQAASVVVLTEPQWKPTIEEQAIARCHRMGQVRPVQVHRLLAESTVDQLMVQVLARKTRLFDEYARRSELKDASVDAIDVSDADGIDDLATQARAEQQILVSEAQRLGLQVIGTGPAPAPDLGAPAAPSMPVDVVPPDAPPTPPGPSG
jgi:superfamily II DNA or RNA helicase